MIEMGYEIEKLSFYSMATNTTLPVNIPTENDKNEFINFIKTFKQFDPESTPIIINENKCKHCVYCNLCDKTEVENVYS
jgi:CRISPR-associated protein Cas4